MQVNSASGGSTALALRWLPGRRCHCSWLARQRGRQDPASLLSTADQLSMRLCLRPACWMLCGPCAQCTHPASAGMQRDGRGCLPADRLRPSRLRPSEPRPLVNHGGMLLGQDEHERDNRDRPACQHQAVSPCFLHCKKSPLTDVSWKQHDRISPHRRQRAVLSYGPPGAMVHEVGGVSGASAWHQAADRGHTNGCKAAARSGRTNAAPSMADHRFRCKTVDTINCGDPAKHVPNSQLCLAELAGLSAVVWVALVSQRS